MRIIGIDPGYERVGIAVIEKDKKEKLLFSTCLITNRSRSPSERLYDIGKGISDAIEKYKPDILAIETLLFNSNQKTVMLVAAARGVIMYEAARQDIPVHEYNPLQIKVATTGYGRAEKKQVMVMVEKLIEIPPGKRLDDEYDAIAIALTCSASIRLINPTPPYPRRKRTGC
jgi:crossover junction endodeoxyribonuclease RuvC